MTPHPISTYLLVDTAQMIGYAPRALLRNRHRPHWICPVYDSGAIAVTPVVIDIHAAFHAGRIAEVMRMTGACSPQLHVSVINATGSLAEVTEHLKKLTYIQDEQAKQRTLRFADCVVAKSLPKVLTKNQWSLCIAPFHSWRIHSLDNRLLALPAAETPVSESFPLTLTEAQITSFIEESHPFALLENLRQTAPAAISSQSYEELYRLATASINLWRRTEPQDPRMLLELAAYAMRTRGELFQRAEFTAMLQAGDAASLTRFLSQKERST